MYQPTELSLFTGGGIGMLAAHHAGFRTVGWCENDPHCYYALRRLWPDAKPYKDVRDVTAESVLRSCGFVDVVSGGFPCQDLSTAGRGAGLDGSRSGLFFEIIRILSEMRGVGSSVPYVFLENVPAIRVRGIERVVSSLEALDYEVGLHVVGAWTVGAPHRRNRLWLVARQRNMADTGLSERAGRSSGKIGQQPATGRHGTPRRIITSLGGLAGITPDPVLTAGRLADAAGGGHGADRPARRRIGHPDISGPSEPAATAADTNGADHERVGTELAVTGGSGRRRRITSHAERCDVHGPAGGRQQDGSDAAGHRADGAVGHAASDGQRGPGIPTGEPPQSPGGSGGDGTTPAVSGIGGGSAMADAASERERSGCGDAAGVRRRIGMAGSEPGSEPSNRRQRHRAKAYRPPVCPECCGSAIDAGIAVAGPLCDGCAFFLAHSPQQRQREQNDAARTEPRSESRTSPGGGGPQVGDAAGSGQPQHRDERSIDERHGGTIRPIFAPAGPPASGLVWAGGNARADVERAVRDAHDHIGWGEQGDADAAGLPQRTGQPSDDGTEPAAPERASGRRRIQSIAADTELSGPARFLDLSRAAQAEPGYPDALRRSWAAGILRWPAGPGCSQHDWEFARLATWEVGCPTYELARSVHERLAGDVHGVSHQEVVSTARNGNKMMLRAVGNGWCYPNAFLVYQWLYAMITQVNCEVDSNNRV